MRSRFFSNIGIKLIKFMPNADVLTEGVFTTWTKTGIINITTNLSTSNEMNILLDEVNSLIYATWETNLGESKFDIYDFSGNLYYSSINNYLKNNITNQYEYGGIHHASEVWLTSGGLVQSARQYILLSRADDTTIEIWKAGAKLWSYNLAVDLAAGENAIIMTMSQNAKYIGVALTDGNSFRVVIFTGT